MYIAICMSCVGVSKEQNITIFEMFTSFNSNDNLPHVTVCWVQLLILPIFGGTFQHIVLSQFSIVVLGIIPQQNFMITSVYIDVMAV